jgi:hypothetical protein
MAFQNLRLIAKSYINNFKLLSLKEWMIFFYLFSCFSQVFINIILILASLIFILDVIKINHLTLENIDVNYGKKV